MQSLEVTEMSGMGACLRMATVMVHYGVMVQYGVMVHYGVRYSTQQQ